MYMGSTRNGIEICFNSQTVLILLLLLKQFVGLNCCHLTKVVVHLNPINSFVKWACSRANGNALGRLKDVTFNV